MAGQSEKTPTANTVTNNEITTKKKTWDAKSHEKGVNILANHLFGINEKESDDGFPDIEFTDNFDDKDIKVFMKVMKKIVEFGETTKIRNQNLVKEGLIIQSEEKTTSLNSGLTHLNKYIYPTFSKKYTEWIVRKRTDARINSILEENKKLKEENNSKKRKKVKKNDHSSDDESNTKSSNSETDTDNKSKKKCTKNPLKD